MLITERVICDTSPNIKKGSTFERVKTKKHVLGMLTFISLFYKQRYVKMRFGSAPATTQSKGSSGGWRPDYPQGTFQPGAPENRPKMTPITACACFTMASNINGKMLIATIGLRILSARKRTYMFIMHNGNRQLKMKTLFKHQDSFARRLVNFYYPLNYH